MKTKLNEEQIIRIVKLFEEATGAIVIDEYCSENDLIDQIKYYSSNDKKTYIRRQLVHAAGCTYPTCCTKLCAVSYAITAYILDINIPRSYRWVTKELRKIK